MRINTLSILGEGYQSSVRCAPFEALYGRKCRSPIMWAEIGEGDYGLLKVSPWKGVIRFGKKGKLAPRFVGPSEIIEKVGPVAYRLDLHEELHGVHDTFHVSNLKKCLADPTLQVPLDEIHVDAKLNFVEESVEILEREFKKLKRSRISIVKVWYVIGVATLRALVRAGDKTSGDAWSWYMIGGDAKSWVLVEDSRSIRGERRVVEMVYWQLAMMVYEYPIVHLPLHEMSLYELSMMMNLGTPTPEPLANYFVYEESDDDIEVTPAYTPSPPFLTTMEPADTLLMGDEVISTTPARETNKFIKSSVDDLVPILKESEVTSDSNLECDMHVNTPLPPTDVREENFDINSPPGEYVVDFLMENEDIADLPRHLVKQLFSYLLKHSSFTKRMSDEPLGDDSKPRSYDVTFSNPLFYFNDEYTLCYDNPLFDDKFEDISSLDPHESTLVIDESTLLVTPPPASKQFSLRKVERFDSFFS
ncbi:hypothetical protein Tco_0530752 [Tanacetum coccineum]